MRLKQIHWLFLLAALPALISLSLFAYLSYQRDSAAFQLQTLQTAKALSQVIDRVLIGTTRQTEVFGATASEIDRGDMAAFYRRAKSVMVDSGRVEAVVLTDSSGQILLNTLVPYGQPLPVTDHLDQVAQVFATGRTQISNLVRDTVTGRLLVTFDTPVKRGGSVVYALHSVFFPDRLERFIREEGLPAGWIVVIFDRNGVVVSCSQNKDKYVGQTVSAPLLTALNSKTDGYVSTYTLGGVRSAVVFHRSERTGYGVGLVIPKAIMNARLRSDYGYATVGIALLALLSVYMSLRFGGVLESERKADAARIEFESRFHAIFESSKNGILIVDIESHRIVDANPAICLMLGYSREELIGKQVGELHPPDEVAKVVEDFEREARGLKRLNRDLVFMRRDGSTFPADVNVSHLAIQGRSCMAGIISDLTERKRMEAELESYSHSLEARIEERTAALQRTLWKLEETQFAMDRVGIGIHWVDPATARFIYVNDYGSELFGYSAEEMLKLTVHDVDATFPPERFATLMAELRQKGKTRFETAVKAKDGHEIQLELTLYYAHGKGGRPDRLIVFLVDIGQRKLAEQALLESEERLRLFIRHAPVALALFDRDMRYLEVSDRWLSDYRLDARKILGRSHYEVFAGFPERWKEVHRRALQGEILRMDEDRYERADGGVQWLRWEVRPWRRADGEVGGIAIFTEDISQRKQAETEIQSLRAEMDHLTRLQVAKQTVSAIAHELNQPLNAVASYSEAALRLLRSGNAQPDRLAHALEGSAQQAKRAGRVVRELLTYLNQEHVQYLPIPFNELVLAAIERVKADGRRGFIPALQIDPELAPVMASRLQIEKVLVNLIENGLEAMKGARGGTGRMSILVHAGQPGMAQVTVRDEGPGIDPEALAHVFDAFYTTKQGGLGMGLAISRAIVEAHGGQLWAESGPGPGASFHFTLPFAT